MVRNDVAAQREAEPRPLAHRLGREERLEDLGADVGGDAGPDVGDLQTHAPARGVVARHHGHTARRGMAAQSVVRVGHEVDQHLVQLVGIDPQHR